MLRATCALFVTTIVLAGCGEDGDARYAGWTVYDAPGGEYRVRFLDPPWFIVSAEGAVLELEIESNAEHFRPGSSAPPKYEFRATIGAGSAESSIAAEQAAAIGRGEGILAGPRAVTTEAGDRGRELLTEQLSGDRTRYLRYVYLDRSRGGVVSLWFEGNPDLDEAEIDVMIASVEVDPEPAEDEE